MSPTKSWPPEGFERELPEQEKCPHFTIRSGRMVFCTRPAGHDYGHSAPTDKRGVFVQWLTNDDDDNLI